MKLYTVIRIPKSGSRSLGIMMERSLPSSQHFKIPQMLIEKMSDRHPTERFRAKRRLARGLLKYHASSTEMMWRNISRSARDGDIISGHIPYGKPQLSDWTLQYITLLRDPIERTVSEYHYTRQGYLSRPYWRQLYHKGHAEVAGTKSFSEYVQYLCSNWTRYNNPTLRFVTGTNDHEDPLSFLKKHYFHFGILERMDLFASQLAEKLDAPLHQIWENKSAEREKSRPGKGDLELLYTLLDKDIAFYNEAKEYILNDHLSLHQG